MDVVYILRCSWFHSRSQRVVVILIMCNWVESFGRGFVLVDVHFKMVRVGVEECKKKKSKS